MALSDLLGGTPARTQQFQRLTQPQQQLQNQSIQQILSLLQNPRAGSDQGFAPIEQQARNQFTTQTVPSLAERFTAMGGGQNSSAFQGALGNAASGLEQGLAGLRSQYGMQQENMNQNRLSSLLGLAMQPSFENVYFPRQPGFLESAGSGLSQGLGAILPLLLSGATGSTGGGLMALLQLLGGGQNATSY